MIKILGSKIPLVDPERMGSGSGSLLEKYKWLYVYLGILVWMTKNIFSYPPQLSMVFIILINVKMPTINCWHFNIYQHDKYDISFIVKAEQFSDDKQADVIDAFNTTSRYLDDILNINNVYFDNMVSQIYPSELQLNKANASDTEAAFLDLHLSISNDIVSTKIYDKRDDFDFEIVNFPFLDGDVPRSTSYGVYISQSNKVAKIRNRYNQVPHLTQDTNGKVTNSQKTPQTRAKRSALSQQVTTKHI